MSWTHYAVPIFLAIAVIASWIGAAGLVAARGAMAKLHYTALIGSVAIPAGMVAICIVAGASTVTTKAILVAVFSAFTNAVLTHATARAIRVAQHGDWRLKPEDRARATEE